MEVGRDRLAHAPVLVAAEHEHVRLVGPADAQSVERSGTLDLGLMGEIASRTVRLGTPSDDARRAAGVIQFPRWITAEGIACCARSSCPSSRLLALPAGALAAEGSGGGGHKDRTTEIMLGIIFVLHARDGADRRAREPQQALGVRRLRPPRGGRRRVQA